ncbi:MAG: response regulator [Nostocaceae cyanobacterium]|nr:response regulator [Nostocaceae cyanobacterium]
MHSNKTSAYSGNILIVDDTPENLQILSSSLIELGYTVKCVIKSSMALRVAKTAPLDLILLDIIMPEMDGYQVCEQLKSDPETRDIPIIFISGLYDVFDKVKALQLGGVDYITKPFKLEEVIARIENQLTIQRLAKQLKQQNQQLQQEVEERRRAEKKAAAASQAKSEFLANMSHELRTPLNAIFGFTQLMRRYPWLTIEQLDYLRIINSNCQHLNSLINEVLQLSKIESGMIDVDEKVVDLYRLIDNLEEIFIFKTELKNIFLNIIIQPNVSQYIKTDETKLRSCLINLLENAIKFTEHGSITLRVWEDNNEDAEIVNSRLWFEVEDTGKGIAADEIDKLFDAFVQTESGKQSVEGTGLGLAITRKFVELMGGNITVESVVGKGTIFKFYIKIYPAQPSEITYQSIGTVVSLAPEQQSYRILVVDDTTDSRLLLVKLLQPIGFEVREAENGEQAISVWQNWQPHLIWMDTRMPVMNGVEATISIRATERSQIQTTEDSSSLAPRCTVIIALTASTFEEQKEEILAAGFDDFLRKPFDEQVLLDTMTKYLGVRYIYENLYENLPQLHNVLPRRGYDVNESAASIFIEEFGKMPREWVQQLYQGCSEVNEDLIADLIAQIPESQAFFMKQLQSLIKNFRLDIIASLTQSFLNQS